MKENTIFLIDKITIDDNIDDMEIITPTHFDFAMTALGISSKTKLAKRLSVGTSTLDALNGVINRKVSLGKRIEVRKSLDEILLKEGWVFLKHGGIARIPKEESTE